MGMDLVTPAHQVTARSATSKRVVVLLLSVLGCLAFSSGSQATIEELLVDPDAARTFDYCACRFTNGGSAEGLPDFESILANEDKVASEDLIRAAALTDAGTKIAIAAESTKACKRVLEKGKKTHEKRHAKALKSLGAQAQFKPAKDSAIAAIQSQVADLWVRDQAARQVYVESQTDDKTGAPFWTRRLAVALATGVDAEATASMKALLEKTDWIDAHRFGDDIASHAWILAQHADDHPDFQALALSRMEPYLDNGGVRKRDYAYLWDRVAVNYGRKQRYGTQPDWECENGKMALQPLEDAANVDQLRAEMGLGPVQNDLDQMNRSICGG